MTRAGADGCRSGLCFFDGAPNTLASHAGIWYNRAISAERLKTNTHAPGLGRTDGISRDCGGARFEPCLPKGLVLFNRFCH
ncbi:hypothetical protein C8P63_11555 [Melghirimyces profundicolus]|uniref:Uncharacterized protein n=1 Tax=Melghirimyces profundicolus TaxID=1242148 RepID=A0A2T6BRP6_9BACL|nr:hypothetical protein C8P63_11555 [Melghirimyces profundicolus]